MVMHAFIAGCAFVGLFILFLVLSKTLNNIINHMTKIEYLLRKEIEFTEEEVVVHRQVELQRQANRRRAGGGEDEEQAAG